MNYRHNERAIVGKQFTGQVRLYFDARIRVANLFRSFILVH